MMSVKGAVSIGDRRNKKDAIREEEEQPVVHYNWPISAGYNRRQDIFIRTLRKTYDECHINRVIFFKKDCNSPVTPIEGPKVPQPGLSLLADFPLSKFLLQCGRKYFIVLSIITYNSIVRKYSIVEGRSTATHARYNSKCSPPGKGSPDDVIEGE